MNEKGRSQTLNLDAAEGRLSARASQRIIDGSLRVNYENVIKQGLLSKKGDVLKLYNSLCHFYFEKRDLGVGPLLKYGKKGKRVTSVLDLGCDDEEGGWQGTLVIKNPKSRTKFKIVTEHQSLDLKAESFEEREAWYAALIQEISKLGVRRTQVSPGMFTEENDSPTFKQKQRPKLTPKQIILGGKSQSLSKITELLVQHETKLHSQIGDSQQAFERFSQEMLALESEVADRKQRERFAKLQATSKEFMQNQQLAMETIQLVTRSVYTVLEDLVQREIEKDPIGFIRRGTLNKPEDNDFQEEDKEEAFDFPEEDDDTTLNLLNRMNTKEPSEAMYDPVLLEQLEEVFHDANESFSLCRRNTNHHLPKVITEETKGLLDDEETPDTPVRTELPFFKDPKIKISIWTVLKDSIHKDISKMSVPVYFNQPLSILQACSQPAEFLDILDQAIAEQDPIKRLAYLGCHLAYQHSTIEKFPPKPFNPLLGETFEFIKPGKYAYLAEQVSHHPPITAYYIRGESGYLRYSTCRLKTKFARATLVFGNMYKEYIELLPHNEKFLFVPPSSGIHNLIIGSPYLEPNTKAYIRNMACPNEQYVELDFPKRGWTQDSYFRVAGTVYSSQGVPAYRIEGKWNTAVYLTDLRTGVKDCVWTKEPYPEHWAHQYGYSNYMIQLNYLPNTLRPHLPPTDTRFRPDQRALENGDFKLAAIEKERLEEKQRAVRRYTEKNKIEHKPLFFDLWTNPNDSNDIFYHYNGTYFESRRKERNWDICPDIFSEKLPAEVEEFEAKINASKKK